VTEADWLACADPDKMLCFLQGRASDRKLRLFACACCRHTWHLLVDERSRQAVESAERLADGRANAGEVARAGAQARRAAREAAERSRGAAWDAAWLAAADAALLAGRAAGRAGGPAAAWLRDLFPRRPVTPDPAWLARNDGTIPRLAQAAYEERSLPGGTLDPARLAVLADALEEAGCTSSDVLGHLRGPGPHVRGCWALDLLLGKG
jgi:hypothetical protein